jgi:1,4-alpha-glucan branching enzyme
MDPMAPEAPGELAIVLHTHMPYVEGHGTWPFGEEWLWEAIATSYLPLLDVLDRRPSAGVTLSLTPVLCDQLEAPGAVERCIAFLTEIRPESHRLDIEQFTSEGRHELVPELQRSAAEYAAAADRLRAVEAGGGGLIAALGAHASWTSAATHPILPLLCLREGIDLQLRTGIESHRRRFGEWAGGFWLPECAHADWLGGHLQDTGVRATCVELTGRFGLGDPRHLRPLQTAEGPVLWPIDRETISLVWAEDGYPSHPSYRAYNRLTERHHRVWSTDGAPYDAARAHAQAVEHARHFVAHVATRVAGGGVCVCALDTELLGHWWYEGPRWLAAVIDEAQAAGLKLTTLDDALERHEPVDAPSDLGITSWGEGGDLRTWSSPRVADYAWRARGAELATLAGSGTPSDRALRELLALQSSDWAFLAYRDWAGPYPEQRVRAHADALARALDGEEPMEDAVRNLAPVLVAR